MFDGIITTLNANKVLCVHSYALFIILFFDIIWLHCCLNVPDFDLKYCNCFFVGLNLFWGKYVTTFTSTDIKMEFNFKKKKENNLKVTYWKTFGDNLHQLFFITDCFDLQHFVHIVKLSFFLLNFQFQVQVIKSWTQSNETGIQYFSFALIILYFDSFIDIDWSVTFHVSDIWLLVSLAKYQNIDMIIIIFKCSPILTSSYLKYYELHYQHRTVWM